MLIAIGSLLASNILFGQTPPNLPDGSQVNPDLEKTIKTEAISLEKKSIFIPKDPLIAGLLSAEFPGLGQIYCRRYLRGVTFVASELGCVILGCAIAGVETKQYSWTAVNEEGKEKELTKKETISKWDDLSGLERAGVVGLFLGGVGLHIWNVIDAYNLAQEHNQKLSWIRDVDLQIGLKDDAPFLKLATSKKF